MERLVGLSSRMTLVVGAVQQYLDAQREFLVVLERCSVKGWPDRREALRTAFRLQELYCERKALRLMHLQDCVSDDGAWNSYTSISAMHKRLEDEWQASEDQELSKSDATYRAIQAQIEELASAVDSVGLEGPLSMMKGDPEYIAATRALSEEVRRLDRELAVDAAGG
jgi:hypothetical protein